MSISLAAAYDGLSQKRLKKLALDFVKSSTPADWDKSLLDQFVYTVIPRSIFLRSLPRGAHVLDLGAGDGSLAIFKGWPLVSRPDIKMYAVSLDVGERFDLYESYELSNFEEKLPDFGGMMFDAVVCAHFIEHLTDPSRALKFFSSRLKPGGRVYLEWPHPISKTMPSLTAFHELGVKVMTTNFFDDQTHVDAWNIDKIVEYASDAGLQINTYGRLWFDYAADQLLAHGKASNDPVALTYAVWYKFAWAQYLLLSKPLDK